MKFQFGFNSYPPSVEINEKLLNQIIIYINLLFYFGSMFFLIQLFGEKKAKFNLILNGLGISKTTNFLSLIPLYFIINSAIFYV